MKLLFKHTPSYKSNRGTINGQYCCGREENGLSLHELVHLSAHVYRHKDILRNLCIRVSVCTLAHMGIRAAVYGTYMCIYVNACAHTGPAVSILYTLL